MSKRSAKRRLLKALTEIGCFATGIIYGSIGVIALLSFMKLKNGGADEISFFVLLSGFTAGRILIWMIILGALCFIIWRFYEALADPYKRGNDISAILVRTGAACSSFADAFIVLSALQAIYSSNKAPLNGQPVRQRTMVADMLHADWGRTALIAIALIMLATALVLFFYGLSSRFTERLRASDLTKKQTYAVHAIAYAGYCSRGVILGIIGFFFLKAAIKNNSRYVVNTDKAFDFIGDNIGGVAFIIIAIGTISYGLYMLVLGLHYDIDDRKE